MLDGGSEEVADDVGDLVVLREEPSCPFAQNRAHLASTRMSFTVGPLGSEKCQNVSEGLCMIFLSAICEF